MGLWQVHLWYFIKDENMSCLTQSLMYHVMDKPAYISQLGNAAQTYEHIKTGFYSNMFSETQEDSALSST